MHYESNLFAVILLGVGATLLNLFGLRRYPYAINPLFQFATFDIGVLTVLSALVVNELNEGEVDLLPVLNLSALYMAGFFFVFLPRRFYLPCKLFCEMRHLVEINKKNASYSIINQCILIMLFFALFILLMWSSGAGIIWLTDPRMAYQSFRAGVGFMFLMVQWVLLASLLYYFWARKPRLTGLVMGACLYTCAAYFTGSKANILSGLVMAGVYYNFFVRKIEIAWLIIAPPIAIGAFVLILLLQGSYEDTFSSLQYFRDYVETTVNFLERFDEFGLQWGYAALSDLWFYVPRAFYPDKPFEYGVTLIHRVLFPGFAEQGATPGVLSWALAYLDFGAAGVFLTGIFAGFIRRGVYESFLLNRKSVLAFVLMMQLSLMPVFAYANFSMSFIIGLLLSWFFSKKFVLI